MWVFPLVYSATYSATDEISKHFSLVLSYSEPGLESLIKTWLDFVGLWTLLDSSRFVRLDVGHLYIVLA